MAPAADDALDGDEKSIFRCLDGARYVVAAAVTVLIMAVIAYAIKVVLRPAELALWVVDGTVSAKRSGNNATKPYNFHVGGDDLTFGFNLRTVNPSGRVSIYYTGISGKFKARNSTGAVNTFFSLLLDDLAVGPQSTVDADMVFSDVPVARPYQEEYFKALANGTSIDDVWLMLTGTRTVEVYSGHNLTDNVPAVYYCSPITVGNEDDDRTAAMDAVCTKDPPTAASQ